MKVSLSRPGAQREPERPQSVGTKAGSALKHMPSAPACTRRPTGWSACARSARASETARTVEQIYFYSGCGSAVQSPCGEYSHNGARPAGDELCGRSRSCKFGDPSTLEAGRLQRRVHCFRPVAADGNGSETRVQGSTWYAVLKQHPDHARGGRFQGRGHHLSTPCPLSRGRSYVKEHGLLFLNGRADAGRWLRFSG